MSDDASARSSVAIGGLPMTPGRWYMPHSHAGLSTISLATNNRSFAMPIAVGRACVLTGLGIDITLASEAGGVVRLGLCLDSGGMPGPVLVDGGTIDGTVTGFGSVAFSVPVQPDWYWMIGTPQSCPTTRPTVRCYQQGGPNRVGDATGGGSGSKGAYIMDAVTGALPAFIANAAPIAFTSAPAFWLKA